MNVNPVEERPAVRFVLRMEMIMRGWCVESVSVRRRREKCVSAIRQDTPMPYLIGNVKQVIINKREKKKKMI